MLGLHRMTVLRLRRGLELQLFVHDFAIFASDASSDATNH